ncbi:MAG: tetratricopeptide repeat protein, partial [Spirochaetales bacterium]|nr:tetratricopeptide repeat protein [Spirochaetales bacterium]
HLYKAYAMSVETSDLSRLKTLSNLVEYHLALEELEKTLGYIEEALPLAETNPLSQDAAVLYHNTAVVYRRKEDYQRSIDYIQKALEINTKLESFGEMASNYYILASVYSRLNQPQEALDYAELALTNDKKVENRPGIAADLLALGILHQKEGREETAYTYFEKAYHVYETLQHPEGMRRCLQYLRESAVGLGKDADAEVYTRALEILEERS